MNKSQIFSEAHKQAKKRVSKFESYREALSFFLKEAHKQAKRENASTEERLMQGYTANASQAAEYFTQVRNEESLINFVRSVNFAIIAKYSKEKLIELSEGFRKGKIVYTQDGLNRYLNKVGFDSVTFDSIIDGKPNPNSYIIAIN